MIELPFAGLRRRVLVSRERVKFADADPYGHLASGAYVSMIMSHRVEALDDLVGFSIMRYAGAGVAFPARNVEVSYLRPAFVGESLEVGSWIEELGTSSFEVRAIVSGATDRKARALARVNFVTVDSKSGKAVPVPELLPSAASSNPLVLLPPLPEYLGTVKGIPEQWVSVQADAV
jgi:YbgC/YbaW family acyl-CoA thioester hydrolase